MARGPEARVKDWLDYKLKIVWPNSWRYKAPGGRFGRKGIPDYIICESGLFIVIEVKAEGRNPTPMQNYEINLIAKAGGIRCIMRGKNEVLLQRLIKLVNERGAHLKKAIQIQKQHNSSKSRDD